MTAMTSRRAVLAGVAAVPALSLPAIAGADPIFGAIERHRKAEADYLAACDVAAAADRDRSGRLTDEIRDLEAQSGEVGDIAYDRLVELVAATPVTVAGCAAMLRHIERHLVSYDHVPLFKDWRDLEESGSTLLGRIAKSLEGAA